jgi:tRNA/rRNA methyltransferase
MKRVVLVRTLGPRNVGSVMRAAANFGVDDLVLVAPQRASMLVHPEFVQMAHGVQDVRARIRVVATLAEALVDSTSSIGFTARARGLRKRKDWRAAAEECSTACTDPAQCVALVFGSEESGLTAEETDLLGELCSLPTAAEHTSLNLALAVGIVLYTLYSGKGVHVREKGPVLAARESAEYLKARLKEVLGARA